MKTKMNKYIDRLENFMLRHGKVKASCWDVANENKEPNNYSRYVKKGLPHFIEGQKPIWVLNKTGDYYIRNPDMPSYSEIELQGTAKIVHENRKKLEPAFASANWPELARQIENLSIGEKETARQEAEQILVKALPHSLSQRGKQQLFNKLLADCRRKKRLSKEEKKQLLRTIK